MDKTEVNEAKANRVSLNARRARAGGGTRVGGTARTSNKTRKINRGNAADSTRKVRMQKGTRGNSRSGNGRVSRIDP